MSVRGRWHRYTGLIQRYFTRRVTFGKNVFFNGIADLNVHRDARVRLGDDVVLNSSNENYHANMANSVKIMADRPGAQITIGARTRLNGACIHAWENVTIGADCLMAAGVQIMDANGHEIAPEDPASRNKRQDKPRPVVIGDAVWLGMNVIVLPGATIGSGSVVGANSVVSGTIPPNVVASGQPARPIRSLKPTIS